MSIRNALLNIILAVGLIFMLILVAAIDSIPLWALVIIAILAWIGYILLVVRDHQRDIRFPIFRIRPEASHTPERVVKTPQTTVYDQKEEDQR